MHEKDNKYIEELVQNYRRYGIPISFIENEECGNSGRHISRGISKTK